MAISKHIDPSDIASKVRDLQKTGVKAWNAINNAAGQTLTVAQLLGGYIDRSGAAAVTDTTPTAAAIIAAIPGAAVGDVIEFTIRNRNSGTLTLGAGTGVTLEGTTTIATVNTRNYVIRVTGASTVTISGVMTGAN